MRQDERDGDGANVPFGANDVVVIAIGRNEGARFEACARSVAAQTGRFVYVDSGSTDGSVAFARGEGAEVVTLDMSVPFTAARARNAGAERAMAAYPDAPAIQFIDGDCELVEGWLAEGAAALSRDAKLGVVTGWREERRRDATVYNMMCDVEWHQPAGPITACGGDMMVRTAAFEAAGGFDPTVIAAEDDEFCLRIGAAGWRLLRLPERMTVHDAAMTRFGEWWQRAVRAGHGYAQVGALHEGYFAAARRRTIIWGAGVPLAALVLGLAWWPLSLAVLGLYPLSYLRTRRGLEGRGVTPRDADRLSRFLTIVKVPNLIGMATYWRRRLSGRAMTLIEYK